MTLKCAPVIEKIKAKVAATDPNSERKALFVYLVNITVDGKQVQQYTLDLKKLKAYDGPYEGTPDVTVTVDDETLLLMGLGKVTREEALEGGKLKAEGDENGVKVIRVLVNKFLEGQKK